jgi:hypothetical protein
VGLTEAVDELALLEVDDQTKDESGEKCRKFLFWSWPANIDWAPGGELALENLRLMA